MRSWKEAKMGFFDDAVPGGNIAKPLIVALGALLVGKMMSGGSAPAQATASAAGPLGGGSQPASSGLLGGLGGLLEKLSNAGHGDAVKSWLGPGQNATIQPASLGSALGQTTVSDLARTAGMSETDLLAHLSRVLPGVVDKLTPTGRIPDATEVQAALNR
jgi:uncharacterized protein YidB (DUF937 family)